MGVSTMSDYERNVATAPFGHSLGGTGAIAVDQGLRAYMLRIYNFMVLGLAITALGALGTYMLSVTTDPSVAALYGFHGDAVLECRPSASISAIGELPGALRGLAPGAS